MVEKAELDILEIESPNEAELPGEEALPEDEPGSGGEKKRPLRVIVLVSLALVVCAAAFAWLYFRGDLAGDRTKKTPPAVSAEGTFVSLDNFAVNIKDDKGNYRILACDVALELNAGVDAARERILDLRKAVYRTVRNSGSYVLQDLFKARRQLLKDIEREANGVLGEGAVKQVYFTKYTLL
ncbi:MAG TPA: flagellar basal body-associated FliL family protein [Syntrophales bacterium]|nr:flagellar basal body-associated FliL family protein [Syntrophales bacterium]HRT70864.1 flagellar basal body-associated FliL family protein [Syntrophales bacterium]